VTKPYYTATSDDALDFGHYQWHIQECSGLCLGTELATPDGSFDLTNMVAPRNNLFTLKGKVTFTWKKVPEALGYMLWVSTEEDFSTTVFPVQTTNALKRVSPVTLARGVYYWRIVTGSGKTMPAWTFTVGP
jgi:hypothetical protein